MNPTLIDAREGQRITGLEKPRRSPRSTSSSGKDVCVGIGCLAELCGSTEPNCWHW